MIKKLEVKEETWAISTHELYSLIRELQLKINEVIDSINSSGINWPSGFPGLTRTDAVGKVSVDIPKTAPKDFPPEL